MNNAKKIIIGLFIAVVIISAINITAAVQRSYRQGDLDRIQSGIDTIAELRREREVINREFERTIYEQQRIITERQGTIYQRERELEQRDRIIERLSNTSGSRSESLKRLGEIHRELERRYNKAGKEKIFLDEVIDR